MVLIGGRTTQLHLSDAESVYLRLALPSSSATVHLWQGDNPSSAAYLPRLQNKSPPSPPRSVVRLLPSKFPPQSAHYDSPVSRKTDRFSRSATNKNTRAEVVWDEAFIAVAKNKSPGIQQERKTTALQELCNVRRHGPRIYD